MSSHIKDVQSTSQPRGNVVLLGEEHIPRNSALVCDDDDVDVVEVEDHIAVAAEDIPCDVMDPFFYSTVNLEAVNKDHSTCHHCGEDLTGKRFYNHLFDYHGYTKQQLEIMKSQKRMELVKKRADERPNSKRRLNVYVCECGAQFTSKQGLSSHKQKLHDSQNKQNIPSDNIVCPSYGCETTFPTYIDLAIHVDSNHRNLVTVPDAFRIRRDVFSDKMSFLKWKRKMERVSKSDFFFRTSQKVLFATKSSLYKCYFSNSRGKSHGGRCEQCPAFIRLCERHSGRFEVVACFGHLGHEHETETDEARELRELKWKEIEIKTREEEEERLRRPTDGEQAVVVVDRSMLKDDDEQADANRPPNQVSDEQIIYAAQF